MADYDVDPRILEKLDQILECLNELLHHVRQIRMHTEPTEIPNPHSQQGDG